MVNSGRLLAFLGTGFHNWISGGPIFFIFYFCLLCLFWRRERGKEIGTWHLWERKEERWEKEGQDVPHSPAQTQRSCWSIRNTLYKRWIILKIQVYQIVGQETHFPLNIIFPLLLCLAQFVHVNIFRETIYLTFLSVLLLTFMTQRACLALPYI